MEHKEHRLAAIMFTDICGFSQMMEKNEQATLNLLEYHNKLIQKIVEKYGGSIIKTIGDAFLVAYKNTITAVKSAIEIQHELAAYNATREGDLLRLRIGVHLGDIYFFEKDALGEGINIASRLQSYCTPGRICISKEVFNQISNKIDLKITHLGPVELKNISRDIEAYEILPKSPDASDADASREGGVSGREPDETIEQIKAKILKENQNRDADKTEYRDQQTATGTSRKGFTENIRQTEAKAGAKEKAQQNGEMDAAKELKQLIMDSVKKATRRIPPEHVHKIRTSFSTPPRPGGYNIIDRLIEKGFFQKDYATDNEYAAFYDYRYKIENQARKSTASFRGHFTSYLSVTLFLFLLNLFTSPGFPWFLFPAGGWGIGIVNHFGSHRKYRKLWRELEQLPDLTYKETTFLKKIHKKETSLSDHGIAVSSVTGFLLLVNLITAPTVPWFLIPGGIMMLTFFLRWINTRPHIRVLRKKFTAMIGKKGRVKRWSRDQKEWQDKPEIVQEAYRLKETILKQITAMDSNRLPFDDDFEPMLNNYVTQIERLHKKEQELEEIFADYPIGSLVQDKLKLEQYIEKNQDPLLAKEYNQSLEEIKKQESSYASLKSQKEVVSLRLRSSINSLKRMQLDLTRMDTLPEAEESAQTKKLDDQAQELSHYLDDLKQSYKELENLG